jgi:hypothetical protein
VKSADIQHIVRVSELEIVVVLKKHPYPILSPAYNLCRTTKVAGALSVTNGEVLILDEKIDAGVLDEVRQCSEISSGKC